MDKFNICRFCLENDSDSAMTTPCKCRESCTFVHKHCLKRWLEVTDTCNICQNKYSTHRVYSPLESIYEEIFTIIAFIVVFLLLIYVIIFEKHEKSCFKSSSRVDSKSNLWERMFAPMIVCLGILVIFSHFESFYRQMFKLM